MRTKDRLELRARVALDLAERMNLRVLPHGNVWRVTGPGVDLLLCDLHTLLPADLEPFHEGQRARRGRRPSAA